jgi:hypothetical protein
LTFFVLLYSNLQSQVINSIQSVVLQLVYYFKQPIGDIVKLTPYQLFSLGKGLLATEEEVGLIKSALVPLALAGGGSKKRQQTFDITRPGATELLASMFGGLNKSKNQTKAKTNPGSSSE